MTIPDDLTSTRTHAHRLVEAEFLVGNKDSILSALEGRDREIEALRARVGWEVAERNREAGARNVATGVDLGAIQARADHSAALPDVTDEHESPTDCRRCNVGLRLLDGRVWPVDGPLCSACTDDERMEAIADRAALLAEVRRLTGALATARLDGARAMREAAKNVAAEEIDRAPRGVAKGVAMYITDKIDTLDPAAVVGSGS